MSLPRHPSGFVLQRGRSAHWEMCITTSVRQLRRLRAVVRSRQSANVSSHGADKDETKAIQQSWCISKPTFVEVCLPYHLLLSLSPALCGAVGGRSRRILRRRPTTRAPLLSAGPRLFFDGRAALLHCCLWVCGFACSPCSNDHHI